MTETNSEYDVIVIGAGPAGENAADLVARSGKRAAIVEKQLVGGECSYWGCMPSKALLRPGEALRVAQRTPGVREGISGAIDIDAALERRNALAGNWDDAGQVSWLESAGVELIRGHGRLAGERVVEVETSDGAIARYEASHAVVIGVGTGAVVPPIDGLRSIRHWDNRNITEAKEVAPRLLVLGGGVIGVEMAQAWRDLGADEVTIVEREERLIPTEEPVAGDELAAALTDLGIVVRTGVELVRVEREADDAPVIGHLGDGTTIEADEILVAVGRRPLTDDLGIETVGLEPGRYIDTDEQLRATAVDGGWLYVVGDANGRALLTHTGKYQARIAGAHIAGQPTSAWGDERAIPRVVFTDPQVAAVGLTDAQARDAGHDVRVVAYNVGHTAGAAAQGTGISGTFQIVVDADREVIVGATIVGPGAGEMLHAATIAIVGEVPLSTLWHAIPAFPTISEVWLRLLEGYRDEYGVEFA
jgi:dihydrolipoamide dehydrogenase